MKHRFQTKFGICQIEWSEKGVTSFKFVGGKNLSNKKGLTTTQAATVNKLKSFFAGELKTLSDIPVDLTDISPFYKKVYQKLYKIPFGKTITYGELAVIPGLRHATC